MGNQCQNIANNEKNNQLEFSSKDSPREKEFQEIQEIKKRINEMEIFERPNISKEKYKNLLKQNNGSLNNLTGKQIKEKYIEIYELLMLNDTDKDIVKLYLDFIKKYSNFIKKYKRKTFEEEIEKYKILFCVEEGGYKTKGEKNNFIDYLKDLSNSENYQKIYKEAQNKYKNIYHFNYPIEFSNIELFYYKLFILLISEIAKRLEDDIQNYIIKLNKIAKMVIDKNLYNIENIIKNEDKMNFLIILILYDEINDKKESINFNRLLNSRKVNKKELKEFFIKEKYSIEIIGENHGKLLIRNNNNDLINGKIDINHPICLNNIKGNVCNDYYFFKPFDDLLIENDISKYVEKIKLLLIEFIDSPLYKEAIKRLFSLKNSNCLLSPNTKKDLIVYINNRIKFYPYQDLYNSGITDKYSLYSYIPIIFPLTILEEEVSSVFKVSAIFENSIHELNHVNQDILYFKSNDKSLIKTPERNNLTTGREGGSNLEEILFGRKILNFTLLEALYIINEQNFKQKLDDYKNNFLKLRSFSIPLEEKKIYLKIPKGGTFENLYSQVEKFLEKANKAPTTYSMDTKSKNSIFDIEFQIIRGKCCMGFP